MTTAASVSDDQLLDLYLTGWVAGGVDNFLKDLPPEEQEHLTTCTGCTNAAINLYKTRLVRVWEDPAVRAAVIEVSRAVLAGEDRPAQFVSSAADQSAPIPDDCDGDSEVCHACHTEHPGGVGGAWCPAAGYVRPVVPEELGEDEEGPQ